MIVVRMVKPGPSAVRLLSSQLVRVDRYVWVGDLGAGTRRRLLESLAGHRFESGLVVWGVGSRVEGLALNRSPTDVEAAILNIK